MKISVDKDDSIDPVKSLSSPLSPETQEKKTTTVKDLAEAIAFKKTSEVPLQGLGNASKYDFTNFRR